MHCKIAIKSIYGKYVSRTWGGGVEADRDHISTWEIWEVTFKGNNNVCLRSIYSDTFMYAYKFLWQSRVEATYWLFTNTCSDRETFHVSQSYGYFTFKSYLGYLKANVDGRFDSDGESGDHRIRFEIIPID